MEFITLGLFCAVLLGCLLGGLPLLLALAIGLVIFLAYGLLSDYSLGSLLKMCWQSILTIKNILITFFLIGMLTATWRACGTIPVIISLATDFITPESFIMASFVLNALVSFLIGTSFGTVATMGVICMSISRSLQLDSFWTAGAIISGIYFGDRCSPISTSALLVSTLTETDLYKNIRMMLQTCWLPTLASCGLYYAIGSFMSAGSAAVNVREIFAVCFKLELLCILPAIAILVLCLCRLNVKLTMGISIALASVVAVFIQGVTLAEVGKILLLGYEAPTKAVGVLLNGGGVVSMLKVAAIVGVASCYSGIFQGTGLLDKLKVKLLVLENRYGTFGTMLLTSIVMGMIACNQTLNIMLTHQLCKDMQLSREALAINLEDTAVLVSPAIPWNLAVAVPLATLGVGDACVLGAIYLYLVPLYRLLLPKSCPVKV